MIKKFGNWLELPVEFYEDIPEEDEEKYAELEELGIKTPERDVVIEKAMFNIDNIVTYNKSSVGYTTLRVCNMDNLWRVRVVFEEFDNFMKNMVCL